MEKGLKNYYRNSFNQGITLIALVITMVLHYYYCIKYSNFNGFLESNV